ncbi:hypothetical protein [Campylobacter canadensis]|uniref:Septum formation initiator n=1 Tax=Campylobacter canadensis TaxID=449520 RepID=A0ABS7WQH7_9BACT|nr:hypothetical protein [Campylobacter canadensis]MBZ7986631.1 hypothetical protein [Campylobacter canadensis]MBZ7993964.1 hypothetical protein [Campylobacter canadensis]MBZ7996280.1 hypothetical protein [Campylobacter canadensis]MBZ7997667.1 hypothetical protein [Campylobacter canadensis]MBZ7999296.1 hypothetical protein [Campylobacter canadensis]
MQELLETQAKINEINYKKESKKGLILQAFFVIVIAVFFGIYFGLIFFGNSSVEVLQDLNERTNALQNQIYKLNQENAKLQKDYFELLSIQGDYDN